MGLFRVTASVTLITAIMFVGSVVMWVGVPLGWLYVGSIVKTESDSLSLAILVMMAGALASIALLVKLLNRLNEAYQANAEARLGERPHVSPLEPVLVVSAGCAIVVFSIWFFIFAGASPAPLNLSI